MTTSKRSSSLQPRVQQAEPILITFRVTHSSLGACLNSQAYMCFYVKRHLNYKPWFTPSYEKARKEQAEKERVREREKEAKEAARMKDADKELEDALLATVV